PPEQLAELPSQRPQRLRGARRAVARIHRRRALDEEREVVGPAGRRQRPYVLQAEVRGDLVDPPGPLRMRTAGERHVGNLHLYGGVSIRYRIAAMPAAIRTPREGWIRAGLDALAEG